MDDAPPFQLRGRASFQSERRCCMLGFRNAYLQLEARPVRASAPGARTSRFSLVREAKLSSGPRPRHVKDVRVDSAVAAFDRPLLPDLPCSVSVLRHL